MSVLFEKTEINGMELANRFVRSATWEGMADDDGAVTPKLRDTIVNLAKGGIGLIITSHAYVSKNGQAGRWQLGVYDDDLIEGLKSMTDAVHELNGKIVMQIAHSGIWADLNLTDHPPLAPSDINGITQHPIKEITSEDINEIVDGFRKAAIRAKAAGFDGIQLHGAHGYLLSQFLSPFFNRRSDRYGGSIDRRARLHLEILESIRLTIGDDFPVLIKINTEDYIDGGLTLKESVQAARLLENNGLDAIELSGGTGLSGKLNPIRNGINKEADEAYFRHAAEVYRERLELPLVLVGGIRSFPVAEKMVLDGVVDYLSMSRPFIREPSLINRWQAGDRSKAKCLSDSKCFIPASAGKGIYCVIDEREQRKNQS